MLGNASHWVLVQEPSHELSKLTTLCRMESVHCPLQFQPLLLFATMTTAYLLFLTALALHAARLHTSVALSITGVIPPFMALATDR